MRKYPPNNLHYPGYGTFKNSNQDSELKAMLWVMLALQYRLTPITVKLDHSLFGDWRPDKGKPVRLKVDIAVYYGDRLVCLIEVAGSWRKWTQVGRGRREYRYRSFGVPVILVWRRSHMKRVRKYINYLVRNNMRARINKLGEYLEASKAENKAGEAILRRLEVLVTTPDTPKKPRRVIRTKLVDGDMRPNYTRLPRLDLTPSKVDPSTNEGPVYGKARYENLLVMDTPNRAKIRFNQTVPQRKTKRIGF